VFARVVDPAATGEHGCAHLFIIIARPPIICWSHLVHVLVHRLVLTTELGHNCGDRYDLRIIAGGIHFLDECVELDVSSLHLRHHLRVHLHHVLRALLLSLRSRRTVARRSLRRHERAEWSVRRAMNQDRCDDGDDERRFHHGFLLTFGFLSVCLSTRASTTQICETPLIPVDLA
jgi:hypothetical protein